MAVSLFEIPLALLHGFRLCIGNAKIRKLCFKPWLIGIVVFVVVVAAAIMVHKPLVAFFSGALSSAGYSADSIAVDILTTLGLILGAVLLSVVGIFLLAGVFSEDIAREIFAMYALPLPVENSSGSLRLLTEAGRALLVLAIQMIWLLPCLLVLFVLGFIPVLWPLAFLITAWLLGFQYLDVCLDAARVPMRNRIFFSIRHGVTAVLFGTSLVLIWVVPPLGIILHPVGVAGGAWLLAESGLIRSFLPGKPNH